MAFKSLIQNQVQGAMRVLGTGPDGLAQKQTYVETTEGTQYDPETQRVIREEKEYPGVPTVLAQFELNDMDAEVRPQTDRKALIASNDLDVIPSADDRIRLANGSEYAVQRLLSDPAEAMYVIHVRMI